jgi:malonyl-CoA/methylmalonyl-CoA synthetase
VSRNLYTLIESRFPTDPNTPCLVLPGGRVSYGELADESARYANVLTELGLAKGDRVAAQVEKTPESIFLYLGCLRAGCIFVPMNPAYRRGEVGYLLGDAAPGLFVHRPQARDMARELADSAHVPHLLELADEGGGSLAAAAADQPERFATAECAADDVAVIVYTSGTTGRPKGAMLSHGNLAANARVLHEYWGWRPGDVLLHMLPIFHVHGLFVAMHCALLNGSTVLFEPKFDAARALALLPQATVFMGVPTYYTRLLAEPGLTPATCASMRLFVCGSAPLLAATFDDFKARTGHTLLERYGMTEGGMFTSNPYHGERRAGTVGFPLPGVSVRIVDEADRPVEAGETGHVQVKGDNVFRGYWRLPDKTREEFTADGYFRTGDLGKVDSAGYISIIGRSKDLIISGGLNVYPKEIEALIDAMPGVAESAVIGLPHPDLGEQVTAVVVRRRDAAQPDEQAVISALKVHLAGFKVPKAVRFVDDLPRNAMGKVQKNLLRERFSADPSP